MLPHFRKNRALVRRLRAMTLASREAAKPAAASRTGRGRTRIPFRHAPVPGWACYATAWACRHSRPAFEARRPLLRLLSVVGAQLRVEVRRDGHELDDVLGIAAVVVVPGTRS